MFSDPPLSAEDIPSGLWLCHTCRMTQQLQKSNAKSRVNSIEQDLAQIEQRSRPCTPDSNDVTLSAAKMRLSHKRSISRVSSCSDLSTSADREAKRPPPISTPPLPPPPPPPLLTSSPQIGAELNNGIADAVVEVDANEVANDEIKTENDSAPIESSEHSNGESSTQLRTSLEQLIYAASIMNPKQFELPREMNIFPKFPGDDKG